jgi:hypothetical protein
MSGSDMIDGYVAELAARLPGQIVAELADGLRETYDFHRRRGLSAEEAARTAVTEFGNPATVLAAFVTASPARGAARSLLLAGPVVGAAWAVALLWRHAWDWPIALAARVGFGAAVLTGVMLLAAGAFGVRYRWAGRSAAAACLVVLAADASMLGYVASAGMLTTWPVLLAAALSTTRIGFTLSRLRQVLACC